MSQSAEAGELPISNLTARLGFGPRLHALAAKQSESSLLSPKLAYEVTRTC